MVSMEFFSQAFPPRELTSQNLLEHFAQLQAGLCNAILFPKPQHVHELVHNNKVQDLVEETRFDPVLSLIGMRC